MGPDPSKKKPTYTQSTVNPSRNSAAPAVTPAATPKPAPKAAAKPKPKAEVKSATKSATKPAKTTAVQRAAAVGSGSKSRIAQAAAKGMSAGADMRSWAKGEKATLDNSRIAKMNSATKTAATKKPTRKTSYDSFVG